MGAPTGTAGPPRVDGHALAVTHAAQVHVAAVAAQAILVQAGVGARATVPQGVQHGAAALAVTIRATLLPPGVCGTAQGHPVSSTWLTAIRVTRVQRSHHSKIKLTMPSTRGAAPHALEESQLAFVLHAAPVHPSKQVQCRPSALQVPCPLHVKLASTPAASWEADRGR